MASTEHTVDPPTATNTARPLLMRLHFYAGVLVAPFILVAAITGALYALAPSIEQFVYRDILTVDPAGDPLPLSDQAAAARSAFPQLDMSGMRPAPTPTESTRVYFTDPTLGDNMLRAVFVDPHTARVLGDEATWFGYLPLSTWLDGLHRHLNLGEPGRVYSELAASWLWVIGLAGLYLWVIRPAVNRRRDGKRRSGRATTLNRHGALGVWVLAAMLFLSATGITWSTYAGAHVSDLRSAMSWQRPALNTASGGEHAGHGGHTMSVLDPATVDFGAVVRAADAAGVHAPVEVTLPAEPGHGVAVGELEKPWRLTTNVAAVDPATDRVTSTIDYWRDYSTVAMLADWGIRMHMGLLFGLLNQLLLLVVAISIVTLIVLGYRMWWQRRPTRGSAWAVGRPPLRGGLRRLSPAVAVSLIAAAVATAWFLPVLGVSLLGFVLVDVVVGTVKARRAQRLS
ncbi:MAG: PepSY-associated TM helix domain-containing protein [Mycobacterium sp.]